MIYRFVLWMLPLCLFAASVQGQDQTAELDTINQQRQRYLGAQAALDAGNSAEFQRLLEQLADYPLRSYLEYAALSRELSALPFDRVEEFLQQQAGTVLADRLERQWQSELVSAGRPDDLIRYYNPANTTNELTCHVLKVRLDRGETSALDEVAPLWNVAYSQANACDPVFDAWLQAGKLTADIGWQRFGATLRAGQPVLARYVASVLPEPEQGLARSWLEVHQNPLRLSQVENFSSRDPRTAEIVLHGLQRLSLRNAPQALELLSAYGLLLDFGDSERNATARFIIQRLLFQGDIDQAETLLHSAPELRSDVLVEWLLRHALSEQDWSSFDTRLALLPENARDSERWQYWQARRLMQLDTPTATADALRIYRTLADNRSYYGFLAADILSMPYAFVDRPVPVSAVQVEQLAQLPAFKRAYELFVLGDEGNALREWDYTLASFTEEQILAAGKLAHNWGWHRNGIQAMIRVTYWDDLQLRFPVVYQQQVAEAVNAHPQLNQYYVYAIVRQESAFMAEVISPAGAMGLMQLMPATARELARDAGLRVNNLDLLQPAVNIALGNRYLAKLLHDFAGNRILAAAAYNAGPSRVSQWLARISKDIPVDIWIETLPFGETRGYIQNVLAYAAIYAYRNGERVAMIESSEAIVRAR